MTGPTIRATIHRLKAPPAEGWMERGEVELIMSEKGLQAPNKKR